MRPIAIAATLCMLPACDDADSLLNGGADAGAQEVVFDVPLTTPVATLDADGVDAVCAAMYGAVIRQVPPETRCVPAGIIAGGDSEGADAARAQCTDAVTTCVRLASIGTSALPDIPAGPCTFSRVEAETCDATLETLKPCLDTLADTAVGQLRANLTCVLAGTLDVPVPMIEIPSADGVQACAEFTLRCPGFLGGMTPDAGAPDAGPGDAAAPDAGVGDAG